VQTLIGRLGRPLDARHLYSRITCEGMPRAKATSLMAKSMQELGVVTALGGPEDFTGEFDGDPAE